MQIESAKLSANKIVAPYGSWDSPVTSDMIVARTISFDTVAVIEAAAAAGASIYWLEVRPQEEGRHVLVSCRDANNGHDIHDVIPKGFNVRTRVHEYGGGAFCVSDGTAYFSNYADQRLYQVQIPVKGQEQASAHVQEKALTHAHVQEQSGFVPQAITVEPKIASGLRYADMVVDKSRNCIYCVYEDHIGVASTGGNGTNIKYDAGSNGGITNSKEPQNYIARISLPPRSAVYASGMTPVKPVPIVSGNAFYSTPRISHDAEQLAFLSWDHPDMPWDATTLNVATITDKGDLTEIKQVTSGKNESVFQPEWGPDGFLYYVSDRSGWWNLYRYDGGNHEPLCPMEAEFGQPQWKFGSTTYGFYKKENGNGEIICAVNRGAAWKLSRLDLQSKKLTEIPTPYTDIQWLKIAGDCAVFRGASPTRPQEIVQLDLSSAGSKCEALKTSTQGVVDTDIVSIPEQIEFPTASHWSSDVHCSGYAQSSSHAYPPDHTHSSAPTAHAFYYAPKNPRYLAPAHERPPLLVKCHGGPSGSTSSIFNLEIQYWTSRGFAVADVNYGGSTGYGREYRQRLNGNWGIVDVDDAVNAALHLVSQRLADKERLLISGRSAGGFTVLSALTFKDTFCAGASYYGISDLETMAADTHKFESRYLDRLVAPYPAGRQVYRQRSAIHHAAQLKAPVIFFQGEQDIVVPPDQTLKILDVLKSNGIPCAVVMFEGERHGFSKAATIKQCLESELAFYARVLDISRAEPVQVPAPVPMPVLNIFNAEKLPLRRCAKTKPIEPAVSD